MGWWSEGVMGGDGPCDVEAEILEILNIGGDFFDRFSNERELPEDIEMVRATFTKKLDEIIKMIEDEAVEDMGIGYQVLGVQMMRFGVPISDELKAKIVEAANNDEWAADDKTRQHCMQSFVADLQKYDNKTPTELSEPDEGLFAALAEHLDKGKDGLVNK